MNHKQGRSNVKCFQMIYIIYICRLHHYLNINKNWHEFATLNCTVSGTGEYK